MRGISPNVCLQSLPPWVPSTGELQFSFLAFLVGQSFAGLMQWRALLQLLLGCFSAALGQHQQLFAQALDVLAAQLAASSQKQVIVRDVRGVLDPG